MTTPSFNSGQFRAQFLEFADTVAFMDATLAAWWTMGTAYISTNNPGCEWTDAQAQLANDLMCAHLAKLFASMTASAANGEASGVVGVVTGATEGSVNVQLAPPPTKDGFQYWLSTTPYGLQLRALLKAVGGVGLYVGGGLERASFRKAGGVW
jgi:hypothetical protein